MCEIVDNAAMYMSLDEQDIREATDRVDAPLE